MGEEGISVVREEFERCRFDKVVIVRMVYGRRRGK